MKQLNRIVLVNWYVLGAVEVPIKGNVAVVGPNGSGKSSLLDAIQTVLMGGNKRYLSFNASAGDKSERSLRTYCLGFMDDSGKKGHRPSGFYQLSGAEFLRYRNRQGNLCRSGHQRVAVIPGRRDSGPFSSCLISLSAWKIFTDKKDGGRLPKEWPEVRESLLKQCPDMKLEKRASRFIRELVTELSYDPQMPNDDEKFVKNFRNALKFVPINSPTRFIREFVLDEKYRPMWARFRKIPG